MGPLSHPFFVDALAAGSAIAVASGLVGYFMVLRAQVFTGDALSHAAFAGSLGALAIGLDLRVGLFAATALGALVLAALGRRGRSDDVAIGSVLSWVLGLGVFFLTLYTTGHSAGDEGNAGVTVLFGSIFGLHGNQALIAVLVAAGIVLVMLVIARPLLFASIDEAVARARGVPVRALGLVFLLLAGACAGEATQAVGAMLLVGLLAAPAATAQRLTRRPFVALGLSALFALLAMWAGLLLSYAVPHYPASTAIMSVATAGYLLALVVSRRRVGTSAGRPAAGRMLTPE